MRRQRRTFVFGVLALLAWGGLAFGGVYRWAYVPMGVGAAVLAGTGLVQASKPLRLSHRLIASLLLVVVVITLQLLPLPPAVLNVVSPATEGLLRQLDLSIAANASAWHSLSVDPSLTMTALLLLMAFGALLVVLQGTLTRDEAETLVKGVASIGCVLSVISIVHGTSRSGLVYGFWRPEIATLPAAPFINHNHFAGWLLLALPSSIGGFVSLLRRQQDRFSRWHRIAGMLSSSTGAGLVLLALALLVMMTAMLFTQSRSGIVAITVAVLLFCTWVAARGDARTRLALGLGLALVLAAVAWVGLAPLVERFSDVRISTVQRLEFWSDAWRVFRDFPLAGTGVNTFGTAMLFYQTSGRPYHAGQAHNDYLQILSEGGVLLGVAVVAVVLALVSEIRRGLRTTPDDPIRIGAAAGLLAIALQSCGEFSLQMPGVAVLFAVVAAIAARRPQPRVPSRPISQVA